MQFQFRSRKAGLMNPLSTVLLNPLRAGLLNPLRAGFLNPDLRPQHQLPYFPEPEPKSGTEIPVLRYLAFPRSDPNL